MDDLLVVRNDPEQQNNPVRNEVIDERHVDGAQHLVDDPAELVEAGPLIERGLEARVVLGTVVND